LTYAGALLFVFATRLISDPLGKSIGLL